MKLRSRVNSTVIPLPSSGDQMNRIGQRRLYSLIGVLLLLLATLSCGDFFERDTSITVKGINPPTFELSGNGNLMFLAVSNDSPNKVENRSHAILWKIIPRSERSYIGKLPAITYGVVPEGFVQETPANGSPLKLAEDTYYQVFAPTSNANGGSTFFIIQDNRAAEVAH
jgi:hypothetical protein